MKREEIINKPMEWSEKDEDMLLSAIEYVQTYPAHRQSVVNWLKSLPERFNLQPKQEWSEEDEKTLNAIIGVLKEIKSQLLKRLEDWDGYIRFLESLRPQLKQEWSEKDNNMLNRAISLAKRYNNGPKDEMDDGKYYGELLDWLESLSPQPKCKQKEIVLHWESGHPEPHKSVLILRHGNVVVEGEWNEETGRWYQYGFRSYLEDNEVDGWMNMKSLLFDNFNFHLSWKPSEEQMDALQKAITFVSDASLAETLMSLRVDLKKL